jgi:hypothetical protein
MDKKYIYLIISVIGIVTVGLFLFLQGKDTADVPQAVPSTSTASTSSGSFVIPVPKDTSSAYPEWGKRHQVKNPVAEIKGIFLEELSRETSSPDSPVEGIYFYDANRKLIPLETLQSSLGFSIQPDLFRTINPNEYEIFYCPTATTPDLGIIFYLKAPVTGALPASAYEDAKNYMLKWEPTILNDLYPVLFPKVAFSAKDLSNKIEFKDGKSRYMEMILENNNKISLNYYIGGSPIIIASSLDCLEKSKNYFFDTEENN